MRNILLKIFYFINLIICALGIAVVIAGIFTANASLVMAGVISIICSIIYYILTMIDTILLLLDNTNDCKDTGNKDEHRNIYDNLFEFNDKNVFWIWCVLVVLIISSFLIFI